jgi:hypothetical protein
LDDQRRRKDKCRIKNPGPPKVGKQIDHYVDELLKGVGDGKRVLDLGARTKKSFQRETKRQAP